MERIISNSDNNYTTRKWAEISENIFKNKKWKNLLDKMYRFRPETLELVRDGVKDNAAGLSPEMDTHLGGLIKAYKKSGIIYVNR